MLPAQKEEPQAPDQSALLIGPLWIAGEIGGQPATETPRVTIAFYGDHRLVGRGGCNTYTGQYKLDGQALQVTRLTVRKAEAACESAWITQEQALLGILGAAVRYEIMPEQLQPGGVLVVSDAAGQALRFHRDANAAVQVLNYACDGGLALRVIFDWKNNTASAAVNGGSPLRLAKVNTSTGFHFEGDGASLSGQDSAAQWTQAGGAPVACQVAQ
jgi:heat shock protein HslJ